MLQYYAHYFAAPSGKYVIISKTPRLLHSDQVAKFAVAGKREARAIAIRHNAICWNF